MKVSKFSNSSIKASWTNEVGCLHGHLAGLSFTIVQCYMTSQIKFKVLHFHRRFVKLCEHYKIGFIFSFLFILSNSMTNGSIKGKCIQCPVSIQVCTVFFECTPGMGGINRGGLPDLDRKSRSGFFFHPDLDFASRSGSPNLLEKSG